MTTTGLDAVDELCRLAVIARRRGWHLHLAGGGAELRDLLDLAGVDDVLGTCPADESRREPARRTPGLR